MSVRDKLEEIACSAALSKDQTCIILNADSLYGEVENIVELYGQMVVNEGFSVSALAELAKNPSFFLDEKIAIKRTLPVIELLAELDESMKQNDQMVTDATLKKEE